MPGIDLGFGETGEQKRQGHIGHILGEGDRKQPLPAKVSNVVLCTRDLGKWIGGGAEAGWEVRRGHSDMTFNVKHEQ